MNQYANTLAEKRAKLITEAQALLNQDTISTETRTKFDAMIADAATIGEDIARINQADTLEAETRSTQRPPLPNPSGNTETTEQRNRKEADAFRQYLLTGQVSSENRSYVRMTAPERRDVSNGMTEAGNGIIVPTLFRPDVEVALKAYGGAINVVRTITTETGNPLVWPMNNDTANASTVVGEANLIPENDLTFTGKTLNTEKFSTGIVKVSKELLQDAAFDLSAFIRDAFAVREYRGVNNAITLGTSSGLIDGLVPSVLASGATVTAQSGDVSKISYADLIKLYVAVDSAYQANASWMWSGSTLGLLAGVVDTLGRPLFIPNPNAGAFDTLLGKPVVLNQSMASPAVSDTAVLFGDFSKYILRNVLDLEIVKLSERYAEYGMVAFLGLSRHGGRYLNAGTNPIAALVQAAS
jgi:HK97 family phage major capsid protein